MASESQGNETFSWDGPLGRALVPDFINLGVGFSGIFGFGAGSSIELNWVMHGPEKSLFPMVTATQSLGIGYSVDATLNLGVARYSGNASDITRAMLITNTLGNGDFPTMWISGGAAVLGKIGITGTISPLMGTGNFIYGTQANIGGGLPAGPIPVNGALGVSNSWMIWDFWKP